MTLHFGRFDFMMTTGLDHTDSVQPSPPETARPGARRSTRFRKRRSPWSLRRLRLAQVRATAALLCELMRLDQLAALMARIRTWPVARQVVDLVAGYNRVFPNLAAAQRVAEKYAEHGHDSAENARTLCHLMATTRPSDYPVLFHLGRLPLDGLRVFDLGGTMGNLFFLYDDYLHFPASLRWMVHDLPGNMERGREFARQRGESRLHFSADLHGASGCDLLLVSGALHYFDFTLPDYLARLPQPPRHIIVNRMPLVDAPTAATVQYAHGVMVACRLLNRAELFAGMERIGYAAADSWQVPEFSIKLPYDPPYWVREYSGVYFRAYGERGGVSPPVMASGEA
jgi:putative methyltransferase (TIGR04325 family)